MYPSQSLYPGDTFRFPAGTRLSSGHEHFEHAEQADSFMAHNPGSERLNERTVQKFRTLASNATFVVTHTSHENINTTRGQPNFVYRIEAVPAGTPLERIRERRVWFYNKDHDMAGIPEVVLVAEAPVTHILVESAHPPASKFA